MSKHLTARIVLGALETEAGIAGSFGGSFLSMSNGVADAFAGSCPHPVGDAIWHCGCTASGKLWHAIEDKILEK